MKLSMLSPMIAGALAIIPAAAAAQDVPAMPPPGAAENPGTMSIQVIGNHGVPSFNSPIQGQGAAASRVASSDAHRFVRCIRHAPAGLLRPIVEGHARDPKTHDALDRVIRANAGCYQGYGASPVSTTDYYGKCNPVVMNEHAICRSVYDRGALIEDAFSTYAPKFMLKPADTRSEPVVARFAAREEARGKFRSPTDRRFYETVACMVRMQPESATRLLRAEPGLEREARLRAQIINKSKVCTDGKKVRVDGYQFRAYVADALYHWTLAAKNLETIIPVELSAR